VQLSPGSTSDPATTAQQRPAHVLEPLLLAGRSQARAFSSPYLIDCLVQVHRNVETIEHVHGLADLLGNHP